LYAEIEADKELAYVKPKYVEPKNPRKRMPIEERLGLVKTEFSEAEIKENKDRQAAFRKSFGFWKGKPNLCWCDEVAMFVALHPPKSSSSSKGKGVVKSSGSGHIEVKSSGSEHIEVKSSASALNEVKSSGSELSEMESSASGLSEVEEPPKSSEIETSAV
jgi:hypothetical protein